LGFVSKIFGGGSKPSTPDPTQTAQAQAAINKEAVREQALHSQIGQQTPFGTIQYTGEIGSPERTMHTALDPADQGALDQGRQIRSGLLNLLLTGRTTPLESARFFPQTGVTGARVSREVAKRPMPQIPAVQKPVAQTPVVKQPVQTRTFYAKGGGGVVMTPQQRQAELDRIRYQKGGQYRQPVVVPQRTPKQTAPKQPVVVVPQPVVRQPVTKQPVRRVFGKGGY